MSSIQFCKVDWDVMYFNTTNPEKRQWVREHIKREHAYDNKHLYDIELHCDIMNMKPLNMDKDYSKSLVCIDPKREDVILWFIDNYGRSFLKHHVCIGNRNINIMISAF